MSKESIYFKIKNLNGNQGVKSIKKELDKLHGVMSVSINLNNNQVAVDIDNTDVSHSEIENCLNNLGYEIFIDSGKSV